MVNLSLTSNRRLKQEEENQRKTRRRNGRYGREFRDFPSFPFVPLFLFAIFIVYVLPSSRAILDDGDALYAHIAQQMLARGDWITPYPNGVRFLDKPPLMFWLMAASFKAFGVVEWAARLPAALGIAGTAFLLWRLGLRAAGVTAGLVAAFGFGLACGTLFFTFEAFPDIFLVFFLTLSVFFLLNWCRERGTRDAVGFGVAVGGAALAKSLIGILFPVAIAVIFITVSRKWRSLTLKQASLAVVAALAVASPWHILVAMQNPGFLNHYFINEQVMRFLGRRQPVDYGSIPIPLFWVLLLAWFFPWSAFLPALLRIRDSAVKNRDADDVILACFLWAGVVLAFFTISSRLEHYSFPVIPPLALLVGIGFASSSEFSRRWISRGMAALAVVGVIALCSAVTLVFWWRATGATIMSRAPAQARSEAYTNLFAPLLELPTATRAALVTPLVVSLLVLGVGTLVARWLDRRGRTRRAALVLSAMMLVFCLAAVQSLVLCEPLLSSKEFGVAIRDTGVARPRVIVLGDFESANSINFYSSAQIMILGGRAESIERGLGYADAPKVLISRDYLEGLWNGPERIFLLGSQEKVAQLGLSPAFTVLDYSGRRLISNQNSPFRRLR